MRIQMVGLPAFRRRRRQTSDVDGATSEHSRVQRLLLAAPKRSSTSPRSGIALLVVLVALAIVSSIAITLLRLAMLHHRQAEHETSLAQSRWLAESALDRTAVQLKADAKFSGSIWSIAAKELNGRHTAQVTIEVKPIENQPQAREVTVIADFPTNVPHRTRSRVVRRIDL